MMLQTEQLAASLRKSPLPLYWIAGDETLLVEEALDLCRAECRNLGYTEREQYFVDNAFSWQTLLQSGNSISLFADKKIVELRLKTSRPGDEGNRILQTYLQSPNPDMIILMQSPRLDTASTKTKWFQQLQDRCAIVSLRNMEASALPAWIRQRLKKAGLTAEEEAVSMLAERVEGNLLAAAQEIEKLAILHRNNPDNRPLDADTVNRAVSSSSRYTVFSMIDTALLGDAARALKMLRGMAAEGAEPLMILAMLSKEIRSLIAMAQELAKGKSLGATLQGARVWQNRKPCVQSALGRLTLAQLQRILMRGKQLDHVVKGLQQGNPWQELSDMILLLSGQQTPVTNYSMKTGS